MSHCNKLSSTFLYSFQRLLISRNRKHATDFGPDMNINPQDSPLVGFVLIKSNCSISGVVHFRSRFVECSVYNSSDATHPQHARADLATDPLTTIPPHISLLNPRALPLVCLKVNSRTGYLTKRIYLLLTCRENLITTS